MRHGLSWALVVSLLITACASKEAHIEKAIKQELTATHLALDNLTAALDAGRMQNATLLQGYAKTLQQQKPTLADLIHEIAKDATKNGPLFTNLQQRYTQAQNQPALFVDWRERVGELRQVRQSASFNLFNDALSDPVNVLADLSDGTLPRVNAIQKSTELAANHAKNYGAGSQYIGNPNYGRWQTSTGGNSLWAWYGKYALFSSLTRSFSGPVYYNDWSSNRGYSYYHDYGRSRYTSPRQRTQQRTLFEKTKKSFRRKGKPFNSPYASRKTGSSALSLASNTPTKSTSSYRSRARDNNAATTPSKRSSSSSANNASRASYSKSSSYSSSASSRRGNSRTSRSYSRGK